MVAGTEPLDIAERYDHLYRLVESEALRRVETAVCGCDYGGTSWTTRREAETLGRLLELAPGTALLEIGCGSGWPALYLMQASGCRAVLSDVSAEGLAVAARRAVAEGLAARCRFVETGAEALPFGPGRFDAIGHSDVLCCLEQKIEALAECRRVVREDGVMAFSVIHVRAGASPSETERVAAVGPSLVASPLPYREMLACTGWRIRRQTDISRDFGAAVRRRIAEFEGRAEALRDLLGEAEFELELAKLHGRDGVIAEGLSQRSLFAVTPA